MWIGKDARANIRTISLSTVILTRMNIVANVLGGIYKQIGQ